MPGRRLLGARHKTGTEGKFPRAQHPGTPRCRAKRQAGNDTNLGNYIQSYTGPTSRPWRKGRTARPALARWDS